MCVRNLRTNGILMIATKLALGKNSKHAAITILVCRKDIFIQIRIM